MTRHPDSPAFIRYLQSTIPNLIALVEEIAWSLWREGDDTPDGFRMMEEAFFYIGMYFSNVDGQLLESEVAFFNDIFYFFSEEKPDHLINQMLQEMMQRTIAEYPDEYNNIVLPMPVAHLRYYDEDNGTDYATQAK